MGVDIVDILSSTTAIRVTDYFIIILAIVFSAGFIFMLIGSFKKFVAYTPNLLTSIGILGTFTGIVIGLQGFDANNIDGSIPLLLAGLKTAFLTSLIGMGLSIFFKMLSTTPLSRKNTKNVEGKDIGPAMLAELKKQGAQLGGIKDAVAGEEESSLAGQMKLLRSDVNDNHRSINKVHETNTKALNEMAEYAKVQSESFTKFSTELWRRLEDFAEMMSKSATEQVINALKEVIADFNKQLTEQFGENFKALDASVQKLVIWQENYRIQLEDMSAQYKQGVAAITVTKASVASISKETKKIPETMAVLKDVMDVNQHQIEELGRHLDGFKEIRDKAVEAVPEIRSQIESTVNDVSNAAIAATEHHKQLLESSDTYIKKHDKVSRELLEKYVENTRDGMTVVKTAISEGAEEFNNKVQRLSENLTSTSDVLAEKSSIISQQLVDTVSDINVNTREMVENLVTGNQAMNESLTKGSVTLAETLASSTLELNSTLTETSRDVMSSSKEIQEDVANSIQKMQAQLESSLEEVFQTQTREIQRSYDGVNAAIEEAVKRTGEGVNEQLKLIDESMNKEVERVMNAMGKALASITGQFTNDYTQLVGAMQKVVVQGREAA